MNTTFYELKLYNFLIEPHKLQKSYTKITKSFSFYQKKNFIPKIISFLLIRKPNTV